MSEYISREAVHGAFAEYVRSGFAESASDLQGYTDKINAIPSADVRENIHARWTPITDSYYEDGTVKESHWECSKCGSGKSGWGEFKFCPDCGADMRGET